MVTLLGSPKLGQRRSSNFSTSKGQVLTTETSDILIEPMQCQSLISKPDVGVTAADDLLARDKPPSTQAIVDRHANDRFANVDRILNDEGQVVPSVNTASHRITSSMDPHSNGQLLALAPCGPDDIEREAVLGD